MKRFLTGLLLTVTVLVLVVIGVVYGIGYYLAPQDQLAKADAIVAISGGDTAARTTEAVKLYQDGWAPILIFSGAALDPSSPSNASAMASAARDAGVPATAILLDENATDTRANATGVAKLVRDNHYQSIILVTSPYHQRRASLLFHRELGSNYPIINHSGLDNDWRRRDWWDSPKSLALTLSELQKVIYEHLAGATP